MQCFQDRDELKSAVDLYIDTNCSEEAGGDCELLSEKYGSPIGTWCISNVTSLHELFSGKSSFNEDLNQWDTSSVTSLYQTFLFASNFNQDLNQWNTSSVTSLQGTFRYAPNFDGHISDWDTSSVTTLYQTFSLASNFTGCISTWNVSRVTSLYQTFFLASKFNCNMNAWEISSVTSLRQTFNQAHNFNGDISSWDTSLVTSLDGTFAYAGNFNIDLSGWQTSKVVSMYETFHQAGSFDADISTWNISSIGDQSGEYDSMRQMLRGAGAFNQTLCAWAEDFPYDNAEDIFLDSGCEYTQDPVEVLGGPFCASECISTNLPTSTPSYFSTNFPTSTPTLVRDALDNFLKTCSIVQRSLKRCVIPFSKSPSASSNIILNPGFEDGLAHWSANLNSGTIEIDSEKHSGLQSVLCKDRTMTWMGVAQNVMTRLQANATYHLSVWAKLKGTVEIADFYLTLWWVDDDGTHDQKIPAAIKNNRWTFVEGHRTVDVNGTMSNAILYAEGPAAGLEFWVDDFSVVLVSETPSASPSTSLVPSVEPTMTP